MKIRLGWLWILLLASLVVGLSVARATAALAADKSVDCKEFNTDIIVNEDGTFDVTEEQAIVFYNGTFTLGYRDIPKHNLGEITDWSLLDASGNTYRQAPGGKEPFTFVVRDTGDQYVINWYFPPRSDPETYRLHYRVHEGLRYYPEGDQIWWNAVYGDRDFPVRSSQVRVMLPPSARVDNFAAYINGDAAADRVTGQILDDERIAIFQTQNELQAGEELEVRVWFPHGVVAGTAPAWQADADARTTQAEEARMQGSRLAPWSDLNPGTLRILLLVVGPLLILMLWHNWFA